MARDGSAGVIAAGHICLDIIAAISGGAEAGQLAPGSLMQVGPPVLSTGGSVPNTGLALHRLGVPARLMGKIGDDFFGRAILDIVRSLDPNLAQGLIVSPGETTSYTIVISPPGVDRSFLHCPGTNDSFGADDVAYDELEGAKLFHFGYPPLMRRIYADAGAELEKILRRVRERGLAVSLDMARPDPNSQAGQADWPAFLRRVLPHVDVFLPSLDEILFMLDRALFEHLEQEAGTADIASRAGGNLLSNTAAQLLQLGAAMVVLKLGTQGLYLRTTADTDRVKAMGRCTPAEVDAWLDRELLVPCFQVKVAGTTGAGDCTIAGFLASLLEGLSPEDALTGAVAVGACSVEQTDATGGVPAWSVVQERIHSDRERRPIGLELPCWSWNAQHTVCTGPNEGGS